MVTLSHDELCARAKRIRWVVSDVDGVLTDAGVYYSERGEELKRFSVRDGMGVELLRGAGITTVLLTREKSAIVSARARKLQIEQVHLGVKHKAAYLQSLAAQHSLSLSQLAYIGDDVNDLESIELVSATGLTGAPHDATLPILKVVHFQAPSRGGFGAFRDFADFILQLKEYEGAR